MAKAANFRANNNAQGHSNRVRGVTLHDTSRERREPPKTLLSLLGSHRGADASRSHHRVGRRIRGSASLAGWCVAGLRVGIGNGISAGSAEHEIHASGDHVKAGIDGLLEHPAQRDF
jgi:hypothetical protein